MKPFREVPLFRLASENGVSFELEILNYKFPAIVDDKHDANWLLIRVEVRTPKHSWKETNPCVLTWELLDLADWLENISKGELNVQEVEFLEPCLRFVLTELAPEHATIVVEFDHKLHPDFDREIPVGDPHRVSFQLPKSALLDAARNLGVQLERFPIRGQRYRRKVRTADPTEHAIE